MGAFVTPPLSRAPRSPAGGTRLLEFPGGVLLHTGLPNPGLKVAVRRYGPGWARAALPVIVHLIGESAAVLEMMVAAVETLEGVSAVEVGIPPDADAGLTTSLTRAARGELPLIVRLPLNRAVDLAPAAIESGADMISLGPPRGRLVDGRGNPVSGRLYGPAIFPQALWVVETLAETGIPVIGGGGVFQAGDVEALLAAGAAAVQLDLALWRVQRSSQMVTGPSL
ncbi:MAG: hypothetical protein D6803_03800 [Anaerolineae bacterium]|nr:MAG: hypothetical protein D6803_03800 [Anaerolineae bacterium]